jgi:hypothetical protein
MNDTIKVGDRVRGASFGNGTVIGLHTAKDGGSWAWVEYDDEPDCFGSKVQNLTRIEPEPVTVTVKYPPGTRVRLRQEHDHVFMVDRVEILYRDPADNSHSWYEDSLEPCDCAKCSSE